MTRRVRLLALILPTLLAGSLFAQQYPEHDHHVFHRPPQTTKHPSTLGTASHTHQASTTNAPRTASSLGNQSAPSNSSPGTVKAVAPNVPDSSEHPPQ
ncbi:MAG: hypothetical protein WA655_24670 [Candidatus Korobacteraceae bacterium]